MHRLWLNSTMLLLASIIAVGCGGDNTKSGEKKKSVITEKGSDTMVLLAQKWAETFGGSHADITVNVSGGGSGIGISALINGSTDIADASRPMKDQEREEIKQKYGTDVVEIPVAKDAVAIYINADNPVKTLTVDQLNKIFTRKVTNWKEVGGSDMPIILYGRENSSGTYEFFKEHVLNGADFAPETATLAGTAAIVNAVVKDPKGIGYGGAAYTAAGVKQVAVQGEGEPLIPNAQNVADGTYALARPLFFYLRQPPTGAIKTYVDWVLSTGQQVLVDSKLEYFPLKAVAGTASNGSDTSAAGAASADTAAGA